MKTTRIVVADPVGLHARPAGMFVRLASKFAADISISNITTSGMSANAKSILGVLTCGVKQGDEIEIQADGLDEELAIAQLEELIRSNFTKAVD